MPASPQVRKVLTWVMIPLVAATVLALALLWPPSPEPSEPVGGTYYDGRVTAVAEETCPPEAAESGLTRCGEATVLLADGPDRGQEVTTPLPDGPGAPDVRAGDQVEVAVVTNPGDPTDQQYGIADHKRGTPLVLLGALFALVIVAFGLRRGLASLAGLAACFTLLLTFVLPAIISGQPPLLVAVVGAAMVMFVIMYLVHGVSVRTSVAVLGTLGALIVTGLLGFLATAATHLTGFVGNDELTLFHRIPDLDLRGVLLAGIIIGSLGVLDDVTVSQSATVSEIARADPTLTRWQLYKAGIRVGRAHIASVVNTLVLAYAGASLPLLLLIVLSTSGQDMGTVLTAQPIAQEIVRSVVATIGLVAAVPLTTLLAAVVCGSARTAAGGVASGGPEQVPSPAGGVASGPEHAAGAPAALSTTPSLPPPLPRRPRHRRVDAGEALAPEHRSDPW
ncbi:YibE/F family protein [Natronosporangium hydrolyticum]|uniref:YibE/F family protein n=2 Tax=Natronosporangium hydrolyticum TaxID=2811111 RepID=A0A895YPB2_9ACTN|nr:YibE/F family protein [Natronosporangium hydrolyticum]